MMILHIIDKMSTGPILRGIRNVIALKNRLVDRVAWSIIVVMLKWAAALEKHNGEG